MNALPIHRLLPALIFAAAFSPAAAFAQEREAIVEPPAAASPGPSTTDDPAGATGNPWERLIYIPFKQLKDVFEKQDATVLVPYLEYLRLWEQSAGGTRPGPDKPPVTAVITEAHYVARVEKDVARILAELSVQVIDKPWAQVPLRFGDAAVGKLDARDSGALLRGAGDGTYALLLPRRGAHTVQIELVTPVHTSPEGRSIELACPPVGITTFELVLAQPDQTVRLTPHLVSLPVDTQPGKTRFKANLGSTERITAHWHPRAGIKPEMNLLARASNLLHVTVGEALIHTDALLRFEVLRGELTRVQIAVAPSHRILDVSAQNAKLNTWSATTGPNRQLVTAELLSGVTGQVSFEVHTEAPLPEGPFHVAGLEADGRAHGIHAVGVVREDGQIAISRDRNMSLAIETQRGVTRVDAPDVDSRLRRNEALYYRFYNPRFQLQASARRLQPRITVAGQSMLMFGADRLRLDARLNYTVERAGVFELQLEVPDLLFIDGVNAPHMKEYTFDDENRLLTITLNEAVRGKLSVGVQAHRDLDGDASSRPIALPLLTPLRAAQDSGRIYVYAPDAIEIVTDDKTIVGLQPEPGDEAPQLPAMRLASAWSYNRRPVEIDVTTIRKPTHLSARLGTTIDMHEDVVEVETLVEFSVRHSGIDTFRIAVPKTVADKVQIELVSGESGAAIKQRTRGEKAEDSWVTWSITLQQPVLGNVRFRVQYDLLTADDADANGNDEPNGGQPAETASDAGQVSAESIAVEPLRVLGLPAGESGRPAVPLSRIVGEVAIVKDRSLFVTAESESESVEPIDIRELEILPGRGDLAYRYFQQPIGLTLTRAKHEIQDVIETVVSRALVEIVLGRDDRATYRCRYRIRSSQRQRLAIELPNGVEPLGVLVNAKQVALEHNESGATAQGWDAYYVNVARSDRSEKPFFLTIQFLLPMRPAPFQQAGGRLRLLLPRIGKEGAIQEQRVAVWVPQEFSLVGTPEQFVRETTPRLSGLLRGRIVADRSTERLDQWIGTQGVGVFDFPTQGHAFRYQSLGGAQKMLLTWWTMPFYTWVISGALLVVAVVLTRTSWENKFGILLLATLVVALYALQYPNRAFHAVAAARYGIVALVAWWLIHALFGKRTAPRRPPEPTGQHGVGVPLSGGAVVVPPPGVFGEQWSQMRREPK